ncbi:MAG: histone deacetylase [Candidatus Sumerlaeaceae bacterium]|nr:histone deacetylase [Candidatus Sumerlaeaceae bacterium]
MEDSTGKPLVYSPRYEVDIGPHVFPTRKYRLVRDNLIACGDAGPSDFVEPPPATRDELLTVHTPGLLDDLENLRWSHRTRNSELPLSRPIVDAYILAAGGTIYAARLALTAGAGSVRAHIGGGFHHAFADHAEGFCYINDIAVAIRVMQREGRIKRAMVVDLDLHQGNGTAHIFEHDEAVFTISLHQENNYPIKQRSDIDIGLEDFTGDDEYLARLREVFPAAAEKHRPELLIYVAGADPYREDQLGALRLSLEGLHQRDQHVLGEAVRLGIPTVVVLAGGYARNVSDTVEIHTRTIRAALAASKK